MYKRQVKDSAQNFYKSYSRRSQQQTLFDYADYGEEEPEDYDEEEELEENDEPEPVSYTHLRAHETGRNLVCRLLLEKKKKKDKKKKKKKKEMNAKTDLRKKKGEKIARIGTVS